MHNTLLKLFPDYKEGDWLLQDDSDGRGPYIKRWNRAEPQPTAEEIEDAMLLPTVPQEVSIKSACIVLARHGSPTYLSRVEAYLDGMTGQQGVEARIEWKRAKVVQRNHPLTLILKGVLGLTEAQIDALFIEADQLNV